MTKLEKAVFDITREFVDSVKKPMIDRYKELRDNTETAHMLNVLLTKYVEESEKAEKDEQRSFIDYLSGNFDYKVFEPSCLIHHKQYKTVIIDILQGKA